MKAIIFDCFGVLVGTGFWNVYEKLGGNLTADEKYINGLLDKSNLDKITSQDFSKLMADRLGISTASYNEAFQKDEVPNQEIFDYIKNELKPKYKLALVSNATSNSVRRIIPADQLELFDEVFISAEVGMIKPQPELFGLALKRLNTSAADTVFVDDHQQYIDGAKKLGLQTILYTSLEDLKQQLESYK